MQAQGLFLDNDTIQKAVDHYTSAISSRASVSAGAVELLSTLRGQGRKVGLISNTMWPGRAHHADLKRFGLASYLQVEVYSADVGFWKPSRQVFNHALEALGSSADHAVFIGDNPVDDITGARNAGLKAIWIANGEYSSEAGGHADAVIQGLPDVLEWLERWESA